jgi:integrase
LLFEVLQECRNWSDGIHVFCNEDKKPYSKHIRTNFLNALKRANVTDFRFHDLRHTAASYLVMNGVDLTTVMEILGHSTVAMTLRYSHLSPEHKRSAVELLGNDIKLANGTKTTTVPEEPDNKVSEAVAKYTVIAV